MAPSRTPNSPPFAHPRLRLWLRGVLIGTLLASLLLGLLAWLLPMEVLLVWAYERAEPDELKRLDAIGRTEFLIWLVRFAAVLICAGAFCLLRRLGQTADFLANAYSGWLTVTQVGAADSASNRWRTFAARSFYIVWGLLAVWHGGQAVQERMQQWPYYRVWPGSYVLPNISDSNSAVIRYLQNMTPPNSRIFIASDQKLFFLSYYLLPRRVYHKIHPESEFVLPKENQKRRLEAYQLADVDRQTIARIAPDYVLEYFEHPDLMDRARLHEDPSWLAFFRQMYRDPLKEPDFFVCLRKVEKGTP